MSVLYRLQLHSIVALSNHITVVITEIIKIKITIATTTYYTKEIFINFDFSIVTFIPKDNIIIAIPILTITNTIPRSLIVNTTTSTTKILIFIFEKVVSLHIPCGHRPVHAQFTRNDGILKPRISNPLIPTPLSISL